MELWNLLHDIPGHPAGSTVSRETVEAAGYDVPEPPDPPPNPGFKPGTYVEAQYSTPASREMIRRWVSDHRGDTEALARWMRDTLRIGGIRACRAIIREAMKHTDTASNPELSEAKTLTAGQYIGGVKFQANRLFALAYFQHLKDAIPPAPDHRAFHVASDAAVQIRRDLAGIVGAAYPNPLEAPAGSSDPRGICFYCQRYVGMFPGPEHEPSCPRFEKAPRRGARTIRTRKPEATLPRQGRKRAGANPPRGRVLIYTGGRIRGTWYGRHRNGTLYRHRFGGGSKAIFGLPDGSIQIVPDKGRLWGMH